MNSTVTALRYNPKSGTLEKIGVVSTLPKGFDDKNYCADVQVHPSGKFVYGSNRLHDSIAIFAVEPKTGKLTVVGHQSKGIKIPRGFEIEPTGKYLLVANQNGHDLIVHRVDQDTGRLMPVGSPVKVPRPVDVQFLPKK